MQWISRLRELHYGVLLPILALLLFSATLLYSLGANQENPDLTIFYRHVFFATIALIIMCVVGMSDYRLVRPYVKIAFWITAALMIFVGLAGQTIGGNRGWLGLLGQTFQPVELLKVFLLWMLADMLTARRGHVLVWKEIIPTAVVAGLAVAFVVLGKDVGSASVLVVAWVAALYFFNVPARVLFATIGVLAAGAVLSWFVLLTPTQKSRLSAFVNPEVDRLGVGYQVRQSVIAVGSGGVFGRGFGLGTQSQLNFLPVQETDFLFSVAAEEFGFLGVTLVVMLCSILCGSLVWSLRTVDDPFGTIVVGGTAAILVYQSFVNIAVTMGLAPVTGIPLPFFSYGGSSLLALSLGIGYCLSILRFRRQSSIA